MSLIVPFNTESLTKRWPQTSSSSACFVSSEPGWRSESAQQAERRRRQRDRAPAAKQPRIRLVELELAEAYT